MRTRSFRLSMAMLAIATACSGGSPEPTPSGTPDPAAEAEDIGLTTAEVKTGAEEDSIVPSPMEAQRALEHAGIDTDLSSLIPAHTFNFTSSEPDQAAVRTGVVLADLLLTVKTADKPTLMARLASVRLGMAQLGGGKDIDGTLAEIQDQVRNDEVARDKLLTEFDELSAAVIPELEFNGKSRVLPLLQAGSWLEGANLVAKAIKASGKEGAADKLLKQPAVVEYFVRYVKTEGAEKAPEAVTEKLLESLNTLGELASKAEPLSEDDLDSIIKVTNDVLALL